MTEQRWKPLEQPLLMVLWSFLVKTRYGSIDSTHVNSIKYKIMKARSYMAVKAMWNRGTPSSKKLCCTRHIRELIGPASTSTNEVSYLNKSGLLDLCLTPYQAKVNKTGLCRNGLGQHFLDLNFLLIDFPTAVHPLPRPCKLWRKAQLWSCTEQTNLLVCSQN